MHRQGDTGNRESEGRARTELIPGYEPLDGALWQVYAPLREQPGQGSQKARLEERLTLIQQELILRPARRPRFQLGLPRYAVLLMAIAALLAAGVASAVTNLTNLGPPANIQSTNVYFPLSGFHRIKTTLTQPRKPVLLFIGAQGSNYDKINVERWPLVKALDQFGTLSGAASVDRTCITDQAAGLYSGQTFCTIPTFDLSHATYHSRYLTFVSKDLVRVEHGKIVAFQMLSRAEKRLFDRYGVPSHPMCGHMVSPGHYTTYPCRSYVDIAEVAISNPTNRTLPLIVIGDYLQTVSQDVVPGDLVSSAALPVTPGRAIYGSVDRGMPFATVQRALLRGKDPYGSHLVEHVNAEANIITALICHADRLQPRKVCSRLAIRDILKHVK